MEQEQSPIYTIKQTYHFFYETVSRYGLLLFVLIFMFIFTLGSELQNMYWIMLGGCIAAVIGLTFYHFYRYRKTTYFFYPDHMECRITGKQMKKNEISYQGITHVGYRETPFQKIFKTGDLLLMIKQESKFWKGRVYIWGVAKAKEEHKKLQQLIHEYLEKNER